MAFRVRRSTSESEREMGGGGNFIQLTKDKPRFVGFPLFDGNPSEEEVGYFEYYEHWHPTLQSVPCAGDDCPLCEGGDKPRLRAKSIWGVTEHEGREFDEPQVMIWTMNSNMIKAFTEIRHENGKVKGQSYRIARTDDRGNYSMLNKTATLTKAQVATLLKTSDIDLGEMTEKQLISKMEKLNIGDALKDDDEDTPRASSSRSTSTKGSASKGSAKPVPDPDEEEEEETDKDAPETGPVPDEVEDQEVVIVKVLKKDNQIQVSTDEWDENPTLWGTSELDTTDLVKGERVIVTFAIDGDGDYVLTALEGSAGGDDPEPDAGTGGVDDKGRPMISTIEDATLVIVNVNAEEATFDVENDEEGWSFPLYFLTETEVDFTDYKDGQKIIVTAKADRHGDFVATEAPTIVKTKGK